MKFLQDDIVLVEKGLVEDSLVGPHMLVFVGSLRPLLGVHHSLKTGDFVEVLYMMVFEERLVLVHYTHL